MHRASPLLVALAALGLAGSGCAGSPTTVETCGFPDLGRTVLVLEDSLGYDAGALGRIAGGCFREEPTDIVLGGDQTLLAAHGKPYLGLNDEGTLRSLDPATLALGPRIELYQGALALPPKVGGAHGVYGVDVDESGDLWVSRDDAGSVAVVKPDGTAVGTVDLADLDPDDVPDMNGILVNGGRAYVAVGFLKQPENNVVRPRRPGAIVVIDTETRKRIQSIDLHGSNPVHALVPTDAAMNHVVVATPGVFDEIDEADGIDSVDLETGVATQVMSERKEELNGSVGELVWVSEHEAYAIILGDVPSVNPTRVVAIDPSQRKITRVLAEAQSYVHSGLALTEHFVLVGDRTPESPKILVIPRAEGERYEIPTTVLPPFALLASSK